MNSYFVTFPTGIADLVEAIFKKDNNCFLVGISDGIAEVNTNYTVLELSRFRFLTHIYFLLGKTKFNKTIENTVKIFKPKMYKIDRPFKNKNFKVRVSYLGKTVSFNKNCLLTIENQIGHHYKLNLNPDAKANEFWFYIRDNNQVYFGLKATEGKQENIKRRKGELRVEIASLMASLIDASNSYVFDPFAGYGGLVSEIIRNMMVKRCIANDINNDCSIYLKSRFQNNKNVEVKNLDYKDIVFNKEIDYIITDPPWGEFDKKINYSEFIRCVDEWLKDTGTLISLVSNNTVEELLFALSNFSFIHKSYSVLIGGNKAFVVIAYKK